MSEILDALKLAQARGMPEKDLRDMCERYGVEYGAILPPINGVFNLNLDKAGL